ncbi:UNVERIFIED_CONTAM: hypothetical protein Sindi_0065900, partial [Sesamum indicum]
ATHWMAVMKPTAKRLCLKRCKSRTFRMGIESPMETCIKNRIQLVSTAFHR